jgi:hypothetical protein
LEQFLELTTFVPDVKVLDGALEVETYRNLAFTFC